LDRLSLDLATFFNSYDNLGTVEPVTPSLGVFQNEAYGETYGFELAATFQAARSWRLSAWYTFLESELHLGPRSLELFIQRYEGSSPSHQFFVRSSVDFGKAVEWDVLFRYVDNLPSVGVPSYFSLDVRLAWKIGKHTEISVVGQNLLDNQHIEFRPSVTGGQTTEIQRGVYGKITWRF
jgi:iron complex outermembrane receptor protein